MRNLEIPNSLKDFIMEVCDSYIKKLLQLKLALFCINYYFKSKNESSFALYFHSSLHV